MAQWIIDNGLSVGVMLVAAILAYSKLVQFQDRTVDAMKKLTDDLEAHMVDPEPHPQRRDFKEHLASAHPHVSCLAHEGMYKDICKSLAEVKAKIDTLDDRIFRIINKFGLSNHDD